MSGILNNASSNLSDGQLQRLQGIIDDKGEKVVKEAAMTAKQEEVTAAAGRVKSLRFA
ncbi:hypothetical protein IMF22_20065 [Pseudomonas poae]|uniref:Uncharacterized protein n=1 Tax=Pseudomonas poae TaxID=200451 RepID=A0A7M1KD88_9PSED|nr:hypothetical protein [Pseudomonas poae]QOQ73788.1 hypothetical protein IMF22_20065 [Pseudomonas poae]